MPALLHLWAGLTVGAVLVMCGLTGSYLAFYPEIERLAIEPLRNSPGVEPPSYEEMYQALTAVGSPDRGRWNIELPRDGGVITSRFNERGQPNRMVSLDPATLDVVRDVHWGGTVSTWIYELHYRLLMGRSGRMVMGVLGLAMVAMLVTGVIIWWRSGRTMKSRLRYASNGSGQRKLYDIHRLLGVASVIILLVSIATAVAMSLPGQVRPMLTAFSPTAPLPAPESAPPAGRHRMTVDRAIAIARSNLPNTDIRWVQVPNGARAPYVVRFWEPGEPGRRFPRSYLWLDQYDGSVLAVRHSPQDTATDRILGWLYPLHNGEAFGLLGRIVVAVLGLVPAALFFTGFLRWRHKALGASANRRRSRKTVPVHTS